MSKQLLDANETEALPKAIDGLTTELENTKVHGDRRSPALLMAT